MSATIDNLLRDLVHRDASDLHLKAGRPPIMRVRGELVRAEYDVMPVKEHQDMLLGLLSDDKRHQLVTFKEVDLSYNVEGLSRFRVNMFWQRSHVGAVFRVIPFKIRTIDELRLPPVTKKLCLLPRGLLLITGPTGSGKSTSLAAMIDHINLNKKLHVMTIEDPIEYVH